MTTKRAEDLRPLCVTQFDTLADGAMVMHISFQRHWIYVRAVKQGRPVRRRYRYGQSVKVLEGIR